MIELNIENTWTYLKSDSFDKYILEKVEKKMSYIVKEYVRFRKAYVDFEFSLFDRGKNRYPTGLFSYLIDVFNRNKIEYYINDLRNNFNNSSSLKLHGKILRDYQEDTVEKAIKVERGIIKIATGGGKTLVAAGIIGKLNIKTLFVVNSIDLLEQTYDEFTDVLQIPIGRIGGGEYDIQDINVCTIQTLCNSLGVEYGGVDEECTIKEDISDEIMQKRQNIREVIENCEMIITDECHHIRADSYVNLMKAAKNAYFRYGLSATPYKLDSTDIILSAYSGKEIVSINASYLIDRGFLVPPIIYFLDPNEFGKYRYEKGRFQTIYKKWIVENVDRNNLIVDCAERFLELNKTTLITVSQVNHGNFILDIMNDRFKGGVNVEFIRGEVKKEKRKELLNAVREKKINVIVGTAVADEGLDLPALDSAIMGGGGKSLIKTHQRLGRTLRTFPGKKEAIIVDFYDHLRYLTGHAKKRMDIYEQEPRFKILKHF